MGLFGLHNRPLITDSQVLLIAAAKAGDTSKVLPSATQVDTSTYESMFRWFFVTLVCVNQSANVNDIANVLESTPGETTLLFYVHQSPSTVRHLET